MSSAIDFINNTILRQASRLRYGVADIAPSTEIELFNSPTLVVWSGASDRTIFSDASVNWAFRALHDTLHLETRIDFRPATEICLGMIQASKYNSDLMRELVYAEVSLQAQYYLNTGTFVNNQIEFTMKHLIKTGVI